MSKSHPSIPTAKFDKPDQTRQAQATKKILDVGLRRTKNVLDSFVTVRDLINATNGTQIGSYKINLNAGVTNTTTKLTVSPSTSNSPIPASLVTFDNANTSADGVTGNDVQEALEQQHDRIIYGGNY